MLHDLFNSSAQTAHLGYADGRQTSMNTIAKPVVFRAELFTEFAPWYVEVDE
jgi:hypothetical protein